jgi:hypothetical protein
MKKTLLLAALSICLTSFAQVPKQVIVEHFTNTWCSACASRNPAFFANLENNPGVIHIAFHPSSPYSKCIYSQHNVAENDKRTKDYGIYGGTPRIVINGEVISSQTNYGASNLYAPYKGDSSDLSLSSTISSSTDDSEIEVLVTLTPEVDTTADSLLLFVFLVEGETLYNAPNGENKHRNVFRAAMTSISGEMYYPAKGNGENGTAEVKAYTITSHMDWRLSSMVPIVILIDPITKELVQANRGANLEPSDPEPPLSVKEKVKGLSLYPNPVNNELHIESAEMLNSIKVYNALGKRMVVKINNAHVVDVSALKKGVYFVEVNGENASNTQRFIKQ